MMDGEAAAAAHGRGAGQQWRRGNGHGRRGAGLPVGEEAPPGGVRRGRRGWRPGGEAAVEDGSGDGVLGGSGDRAASPATEDEEEKAEPHIQLGAAWSPSWIVRVRGVGLSGCTRGGTVSRGRVAAASSRGTATADLNPHIGRGAPRPRGHARVSRPRHHATP